MHAFDCKNCHRPDVSFTSLGNTAATNICLRCHKDSPEVVTTWADGRGAKTANGLFSPHDASNAMGTVSPLLGGSPSFQTSHNWAAPKDVVPAAGAVKPSNLFYYSRYGTSNGKVTCTRCHNPHEDMVTNSKLLRPTQEGDFCLDCHKPWNVGAGVDAVLSHPLVVDYKSIAQGNPKFNYPILVSGDMTLTSGDLSNGGITCTTCHGVHWTDSDSASADGIGNQGSLSDGDGKLLRSDGPNRTGATPTQTAQLRSNLCQACHTYKLHGVQGDPIGCLDCHSGHSYNGGGTKTNAFVLRYETDMSHMPASKGISGPTVVTGLSYQLAGTPWLTSTKTGYCQRCHDPALPHNGYGDLATPSGGQAECASCHTHDNTSGSFTASCNDCHGTPPSSASPAPAAGGYAVSGANDYSTAQFGGQNIYKNEANTPHLSHAGGADYNFACDVCHKNKSHNSGTFQDVFIAPAHDLATGAGSLSPGYDKTVTAGNDGSCSNVYCHSNGDPRSRGTLKPASVPAWENGKDLIRGLSADNRCKSCHGNDATSMNSSNKDNSATHQKHLGKGYSCNVCHSSTASSSTVLAGGAIGGTHINNSADVSFAATFGAAIPLTVGGTPYDAATGTCMVYCHSNGKGAYASPKADWDVDTSGACGTCHGHDAASASPMGSGSHGAHINDSASQVGRNIACGECHSTTASGNAIGTPANHVNGQVAIGIAFNGGKTDCSNIYCHSNGNSGNLVYKTGYTWGATNLSGCDDCHGDGAGKAYPTYANGGIGNVDSNSHSAHVVGGGYACGECHSQTSTAGTSINGSTPAKHLDQAIDVAGAKITSWTAGTHSCSNVSCHGGNSPVWGDSLGCADCHTRSAGDQDDFTYDNGTMAMVDTEEWTYSGHGRASAYPVTGNNGAGFIAAASGADADPCLYCHDGSISHGSANYFRVRDNGKADLNGACLGCHETGSAGVDPDAAGSDYASVNSTLKIDKYHGGARHNGSDRDAGRWCWDCHDPHGDTEGPGVRIQMVQRRLAVNPDANGKPASLTGTDIIFTDNTVGAGPGGFARDNITGSDGICNACHTQTNQYKSDLGANGHPTAQCTQCHGHSGDPTYDMFAFKATCYNCHGGDVLGVDEQSYWPGANVGGADGAGSINDAGRHGKHLVVMALRVYGETASGAADNDILKDNTTLNPALTSDQKQRALCGYCHATPGADADHANSTPADDAEVTQFKKLWDGTADAGAPTFTRANGTCSNIDCHNNKTTAAGTYGWYNTGPSACIMCHVDVTTDPSHTLHTGGSWNFSCDNCHSGGLNWGTNLPPSAGHINGTLLVSGNRSFTYDASGPKTCSTNECHNDGNMNAPDVAYDWAVGKTAGFCMACHGFPVDSNLHLQHFLANEGTMTAQFVGSQIFCADCHAHMAANGAGHLDGDVDFKVAISYSGDMAIQDRSNPGIEGNEYGKCTTTTCHSNGQGSAVQTPMWNRSPQTSDDCSICHTGVPNTGSHGKHVKDTFSPASYITPDDSTTDDDYIFACGKCHGVNIGNHINSSISLDAGLGMSLGTCTATYCHSNGAGTSVDSPPWGGSWSDIGVTDKCAGCHKNSPDTNAHREHEVGFHYDAVYSGFEGFLPVTDSDPIPAGLTGTRDQLRGHGGNEAGNGSPATSTVITCNICHNDTVIAPYNALGETCAACHTPVASPTDDDRWEGNVALEIAKKTKHVNGDRDVKFIDQTIKSKAQLRDDITDVEELNVSWNRPNGYKSADGLSYDESPDTLFNTGIYDNTTDPANPTCIVSCHLMTQTLVDTRLDKEPVGWAEGGRMCIDCHTRLPK
ncbi:c-type cytochrome [Desulfuromonas versatilis]|uniref:C-type cytochrome n=2 Tax=Desulfuromonas versatilis TaxID=2802975 RepID=A0ABM8HXN9_9BACT|nr:c-type cytochrome [Desulfuromonas versatilis]